MRHILFQIPSAAAWCMGVAALLVPLGLSVDCPAHVAVLPSLESWDSDGFYWGSSGDANAAGDRELAGNLDSDRGDNEEFCHRYLPAEQSDDESSDPCVAEEGSDYQRHDEESAITGTPETRNRTDDASLEDSYGGRWYPEAIYNSPSEDLSSADEKLNDASAEPTWAGDQYSIESRDEEPTYDSAAHTGRSMDEPTDWATDYDRGRGIDGTGRGMPEAEFEYAQPHGKYGYDFEGSVADQPGTMSDDNFVTREELGSSGSTPSTATDAESNDEVSDDEEMSVECRYGRSDFEDPEFQGMGSEESVVVDDENSNEPVSDDEPMSPEGRYGRPEFESPEFETMNSEEPVANDENSDEAVSDDEPMSAEGSYGRTDFESRDFAPMSTEESPVVDDGNSDEEVSDEGAMSAEGTYSRSDFEGGNPEAMGDATSSDENADQGEERWYGASPRQDAGNGTDLTPSQMPLSDEDADETGDNADSMTAEEGESSEADNNSGSEGFDSAGAAEIMGLIAGRFTVVLREGIRQVWSGLSLVGARIASRDADLE